MVLDQPRGARAGAQPLVPVTVTLWGMEYSVHDCPRRNKADVTAIFPNTDLEGMLIIPTCQHSELDLVRMGEHIEIEKDRLLERFVLFARAVCAELEAEGHWADYIDPCSGLPMLHRDSGAVYGEVDALCTLLGYKTQNAGCCRIILHPRWGSSVYPASLFARAPVRAVTAAIARVEAALSQQLLG